MHRWSVYNDINEASIAAADFIASKILLSIKQRGVCRILLPGGNTPIACLGYLAEKKIPWEKVFWYLGDERCLPKGNESRNDMMLEKNFWSRLSCANFFPIPAELGSEQAAKEYSQIIKSIESFDIAFLGMGEDGHTASLFPNNEALNGTQPVVPVYNSPKEPDERVSVSLGVLKNAKFRVVLAAGAEKAEVIKQIKGGEPLPISLIGDINWFVDFNMISEND